MYNADETRFPFQVKGKVVLSNVCHHNVYHLSSDSKAQITALICICADGSVVPPYLLFPGKLKFDEMYGIDFPPGAKGFATESGWMTRVAFQKWLVCVFIPHLPDYVSGRRVKIVLLVDGHKSHIDLEISKLCRENGIVLFKLPPHMSHVLQPCDRGYFAPFKNNWCKACARWTREKLVPIIERCFGRVFKEAFYSNSRVT